MEKVRNFHENLIQVPEKPKGFYWSQGSTDLKVKKDLKIDWGCALMCDLWGQNGGQIQNLQKILHKILFRRGLPSYFTKFWNNLENV